MFLVVQTLSLHVNIRKRVTEENRKEKFLPTPIRCHPNANGGGEGLVTRRSKEEVGWCMAALIFSEGTGRGLVGRNACRVLYLCTRAPRRHKSILMPDPTFATDLQV